MGIKQIQLIGNIWGYSGYAAHTRGILLGFIFNKANVRLHDEGRQVGWETQVSSHIKEAINKPMESAENRIDVYIGLPHTNTPYLNNSKYFCQFVVWEGTQVPKFWEKHLISEKIKYIFVPSEHTKQAIINTFPNNKKLLDKIEIISHGVENRLFMPMPGLKKNFEGFTFCANKGWTDVENDRGGIQFIIRAYFDEFNKDEKVNLLLKINKAYNPNFDVSKAIDTIRGDRKREDLPPVYIVDTFIAEQDLVMGVYNQSDCFVTASMGEAFNIPALEAMACGLPVITTNFGGQLDFVDEGCGWKVHYDLIKPKDLMYEETLWAKPSVHHLRTQMRKAFNDKEIKLKGRIARDVAENFTWQNSTKKIIELTKE